MKTIRSINISSRDKFNASNGKSLKDVCSDKMKAIILGCGIFEDIDKDNNETVTVVIVKTDKGLIAGKSQVMASRVNDYIDICEDDGIDAPHDTIEFMKIKCGNGDGATFNLI